MGFHWLIALLIFANLALGWYAHGLPNTPWKFELFTWHKSVGLSVLALAAMRLAWRWTQPRPTLPAHMPGWQRHAAGLSHGALYGLMLAVPISGWLLTSYAGVPVRFAGLFSVPALAQANDALREAAHGWHFALAWSLLGLALLHVGAALYHALILRDRVLRSMLP